MYDQNYAIGDRYYGLCLELLVFHVLLFLILLFLHYYLLPFIILRPFSLLFSVHFISFTEF
jgi:hypothetical protein